MSAKSRKESKPGLETDETLSDAELDEVSGGTLSLTGVSGESLDKGHDRWSDVTSFSTIVHKPGGGSAG